MAHQSLQMDAPEHGKLSTQSSTGSSSRPVPAPAHGEAAPSSTGRRPSSASKTVALAPSLHFETPGAKPLPAPTKATDEQQLDRRKAAEGLLTMLPDGCFAVAGAGASRIPASAAGNPAAVAIDRLERNGGVSGAKNHELRLFLRDWARFREITGIGGEPFPIPAVDSEQMKRWLNGTHDSLVLDPPSDFMADRVSTALQYAESLGLEVEHDAAMLATRGSRAPQSATLTREAAPPFCVLAVFGAAAQRPGFPSLSAPLLHYVRGGCCVAFMEAARGRDVHGSFLIPPLASDPERPGARDQRTHAVGTRYVHAHSQRACGVLCGRCGSWRPALSERRGQGWPPRRAPVGPGQRPDRGRPARVAARP